MNKFMEIAINEAKINEDNNFINGGPFGAVIVKDNKVIATARNTVIENNDPTAHAEINAIRNACKILQTYDLSNCKIYTTCFPCPMCLSAIIWSNIKEIYYACTREDAAKIGFKDNKIYQLLNNIENTQDIKLIQLDREETIKTFEIFKNNPNLY